MRRTDIIERPTDIACYLRAMVDTGSLGAIELFIVARDRLKGKINNVRNKRLYKV
jgi:hypothetical protein